LHQGATCSRNAGHALVEAPLERHNTVSGSAGSSIRQQCKSGLSCAQRDCHRLIVGARRQPGSVLRRKKVPGETRPAEQNGHARDAGCSPRSHAQQRVSQPARAGEIADFDQHPYAVCGIASTLPGLPLETLRLAELDYRGAGLSDLEFPGRLERSCQSAMG